jgi:hypothetical protein
VLVCCAHYYFPRAEVSQLSSLKKTLDDEHGPEEEPSQRFLLLHARAEGPFATPGIDFYKTTFRLKDFRINFHQIFGQISTPPKHQCYEQ